MSSKKKDSVIIMVVVLGLTCIIAGVCLAYTYQLTKDVIADAEKQAKLAAVKNVLPPFDGEPEIKVLTIDGEEKEFYLVRTNGAVSGIAFESHGIGYGGSVALLLGINVDGAITGMQLLAHQETPGLGAKAGDPAFLDQFKGRTITRADESLSVKKDGGDIEAVTAATITSRAVAAAATEALQVYLKHKEEVL